MEILLVLVLIVVTIIGCSLYIGNKMAHPTRQPITERPEDYQLSYEHVSFLTEDGVRLTGWWMMPSHAQQQKVVIFSHAYGKNRTHMPIRTLALAKHLIEEGCTIFMYDFRNCGESANANTTIGRKEKLDLLAAISYAARRTGNAPIFLIGWSMGAATSILAGSESEHVKGVIADSPFADLEMFLNETFSYWTGLPHLFGKLIAIINEWLNPNFSLKAVDPIKRMSHYSDGKPLMLIHSKKDGAISYNETIKLYDEALSKGANVSLWLVRKGGHIRAYKHFPKEYEHKILSFIHKSEQKLNR